MRLNSLPLWRPFSKLPAQRVLAEFETKHLPTTEQWHEAYAIAGVPWKTMRSLHFASLCAQRGFRPGGSVPVRLAQCF